MGDFDGLVLGMIGREHAILHRLGTVDGEIAVQLHHGFAGLDRVVAIDLDFVVVLGPGGN